MVQNKVETSPVIFNDATLACGKGGLWEKALQLLKMMVESRGELDVSVCNAAIRACERGDQTRGQLDSDSMTYSAAFDASGKEIAWEKALQHVGMIAQVHVETDTAASNYALSAYEKGLHGRMLCSFAASW
eukprot:TRINITY_DN17008_c0_g1_i1.p1 TRINITY_DN17008_c0_g1~~TRINITY_DN17008_c0_g1_i1.p1  ORF type:complete len:131 (-),score=27.67 TRINITY_DN17008_c0_g1_i1:212-604(-)